MDLYLVFNDLSADFSPASETATRYDARLWMEELQATIKAAAQRKVTGIVVSRFFLEYDLTPEYSLRQWLNDNEVDLELRRSIKTRFSKLPFLKEIKEYEAEGGRFDCLFRGKRAVGLVAAHLLQSLALSLNSGPEWAGPALAISIEEMDAETIEIEVTEVQLKHVSTPAHIEFHQAWISERLWSSVSDGSYLLEKAAEWLPALEITPGAREQILALRIGDVHLRQLIERLLEFQTYCDSWNAGPFEKDALRKVSPESTSVNTDPRLRAMRMFRRDSGEDVYCEWHARITPRAWRIHFFPDVEQRKLIIGYVGPHLETAKF